jgi:hypothetical protein
MRRDAIGLPPVAGAVLAELRVAGPSTHADLRARIPTCSRMLYRGISLLLAAGLISRIEEPADVGENRPWGNGRGTRVVNTRAVFAASEARP